MLQVFQRGAENLLGGHEKLPVSEPEHLQASSVRGDQRPCQEKLHQGDRVLRVLQATTPPSVHGPQPKLITAASRYG